MTTTNFIKTADYVRLLIKMKTKPEQEITKHYTLGFVFSKDKSVVALIHKRKSSIPHHVGRMNGLGGSIPDGATDIGFEMRSSIANITGLDIGEYDLTQYGILYGTNFAVHVFCAFTDDVYSMTVSPELGTIKFLPVNSLDRNMLVLDNVPVLVRTAALEKSPFIILKY